MRMNHVTVLAALFLGACAQEGAALDAPYSVASGDELDSIPEQPSAPVCTGGRITCFARVLTDRQGMIRASGRPSGFGPADLVSAYKLDVSINPGATIAVTSAFGYANAESDLAVYRQQFNLPPCTQANGCLTIVNQNGQTSPLPPAPPANNDWTLEAALDLDMASAACPLCKLLLVSAENNEDNGLFMANDAAAALGATVISNSWGMVEPAGEPLAPYEAYLNHPGVGIFVASGDNGYNDGGQGPDYPGTSQFVTAVGGTKLARATSTARGWTEAAWSTGWFFGGGGGSACSLSVPKPAWQTNSACAFRASADVAAVGDPSTGVAVYNAKNGGWSSIGGTSAASPFVAGVYALTGHGADELGFAYAHGDAYYDLVKGSNGNCGNLLCNAGAGWDGPTGMGSPNGAALAAMHN